jgi:DNA helicase HerA-like ATPase
MNVNIVEKLTAVDLFARDKDGHWLTGVYVGRPFDLTFSRARLLTCDAWKNDAHGLPQGSFLLAYYDNEPSNSDAIEAVLLRVLQPTGLPTDSEIISSMIQYYKEGIETGGTTRSKLDAFTIYDFSFSGLECSVLGSFYKESNGKVRFGADLENFYSAHNYSVFKPHPDILTKIVNHREDGDAGGERDRRIGKVRYSSSRRFQSRDDQDVQVFVNAQDFAGKRTALFGMTRTGKSNTLKKMIQACVEMSDNAKFKLDGPQSEPADEILKPFDGDGHPKYAIGQIIFDINGEYANANLQDQGTAIFDLYQDRTIRYCTIKKPGFRELKVNFYSEVASGFELIKSDPSVADDGTRFVANFRSVDMEKPADYDSNRSAQTRYDRRLAAYYCILQRAKFESPKNFKVTFSANKEVRAAVGLDFDPSKGITLDQAATWWETLWQVYDEDPTGCFAKYKKDNDGREWADDDLKALLVMLTRRRKSGGQTPDCSGYNVLREITDRHTATIQTSFEIDILSHLRAGKIVIVDLSLGEPNIQALFSDRICRTIFSDSMRRFTQAAPNNFVQFCFEEAHNLFPKKDDKDLSLIYNRIAKEGAKLNLGLIYATQEVSSISSNILKATQNWFIAHLNNDDEIKELRKYYDFSDFAEGLIRFSQDTDKGFVRMKTYSSPFVIPVQVDRFPPEGFKS